jgi:hypothetical protein
MPLEAAAVGAFAGDDVMRPPTSTIFQQARRWYRLHAFIRNVIHLKLGFFNYGLLGERLVPVNPKRPDGEKMLEVHPGIRAVHTEDTERIAKWKRENAEEIARMTIGCWMSFLMLRNVICLWRKTGRVIIRPPESIAYKDEFGLEELTIRHGLTDEQIDGLPGQRDAGPNYPKKTKAMKQCSASNSQRSVINGGRGAFWEGCFWKTDGFVPFRPAGRRSGQAGRLCHPWNNASVALDPMKLRLVCKKIDPSPRPSPPFGGEGASTALPA